VTEVEVNTLSSVIALSLITNVWKVCIISASFTVGDTLVALF